MEFSYVDRTTLPGSSAAVSIRLPYAVRIASPGRARDRIYGSGAQRVCVAQVRAAAEAFHRRASARAVDRAPTLWDPTARWQLHTGLRNSELLRLGIQYVLMPEAARRSRSAEGYSVVDVLRKGRKRGYVIASMSLLEETAVYLAQYRHAWLRRAARKRGASAQSAPFINSRGIPVKRSTYQQAVQRTGQACGFKAMPHLLRLVRMHAVGAS